MTLSENRPGQEPRAAQGGFDHWPLSASEVANLDPDRFADWQARNSAIRSQREFENPSTANTNGESHPWTPSQRTKAGAAVAAVAALALVGGAIGGAIHGGSNGKDAGASYTPSPTSTEQPTSTPSGAAGSAEPTPTGTPEPTPSASPSGSPETGQSPELTFLQSGSVGPNTIIRLPANTVISGDPLLFGGTPGNGENLQDWQTQTLQIQSTDQLKADSLANGQSLSDSNPSSGGVWVTTADMYVQSAPQYGFSYHSLQTAAMASQEAIAEQFVMEFSRQACGGGCQRVDIMQVPGQMQDNNQGAVPADVQVITTNTENTLNNLNPSPSAMPSENPSASGIPSASELPAGNIPGVITTDQEIAFLESALSNPAIAESPTGQILAEVLKCLLCTSNVCKTPAETPAPTAAPTPEPTVTTSRCIATKEDHVEPAGYVFRSKNGEPFIVEAAVTIDGHQAFTTNNDSAKVKQVDLVDDGKNHVVVFNYAGDLQEFNSCADDAFILKTYKEDLNSDTRALDPMSAYLTKTKTKY